MNRDHACNATAATAATATKRLLKNLTLLALVCASWHTIGSVSAVELVDRNPFDPHRRPWKAPPPAQPELPVLTARDLQIEAIVSFGPMQGILAQLDGKLRDTLPANAAGKVRISVGQSFGAGYVLESIAPNQVVVLGGSARYTIPVLRKVARGAVPAPATLAVEQRAAPPVPVASPPSGAAAASGLAPVPAAQAETSVAPTPFAPQLVPQPPPPPVAAQASREPGSLATPQAPQQQPMSLLEAIQAAQAAARNQQGAAPPVLNPFTAPRK